MARKDDEVAKLSPAFMTGGGGENFEKHVAAVFVLSLIVDGLSPIVEAPIKELKFQAKIGGFDVDDFVVTAVQGERVKRLLCQVKHDVTISAANSTFQEVITAAWADFNKPWFNKRADLIALITGFIAKDSIDALRYLHDQAHASTSAEEFTDRINQEGFTSDACRKRYNAINECIKKANRGMPASDEELWHFCRCFVLAVFDLDYEKSVNQALIHSLIKCKTDQDARWVWSRISEKCGYWKQAAATVTKASIPDDILEMLGEAMSDETVMPIPPAFSPTDAWAVAALIGTWNEKNNNDVLAIEKLVGAPYAVFQGECRQHLSTGMISLINGRWKVINRPAVMDAVWDLYFDDTIQNAFQLVTEFLQETSKQFGEDGVFGSVVPASGRFTNSDEFRKGLLEGLCILTNGRKPAHCSDHLIGTEAGRMVSSVLEGCDWTRFVSLADLILLLAEISPNVYLTSLEMLIYNKPGEILRLFPKKHTSAIDQNLVSNLLFSLERLAWHGDYLVQAIVCLSALEMLDYEETNWVNTPIDSMISILNPRITQTSAPLVKIKSAIQAVKVDYADVCWALCCRMLSIRSMTSNAQPKYILQKDQCRSNLSGEECDELQNFYIQQTLSMVGTSRERMKKVVEHLSALPSYSFKDFLEKIRSASVSWDDDEKSELWGKLTDWKYRIISNNDNQEPVTPEFDTLCRTIDSVRPENILSRYQRLFKFHYDKFSDGENRWEKKEQQKQEAVSEIYQRCGLSALVEFGISLNAEYDIGYRLGQLITTEEMSEILPMCKACDHEIFYANVIGAFFRKNGMAALKEINVPMEDPELVAFVFRHAPFTQELLDLIPEYLPENENKFWETVRISPYYYRHADYDAISVAQILMQHHRTPAAITLLGDAVDELQPDPQLICNMLIQAPNEQQLEKIDPDSTRALIKYLQDTGVIELKTLSQIEFYYLIWLDEYSEVKPRAIEFRLANEPNCFCELMAITYKKRHDAPEPKKLSKVLSDRIFQLTFKYSIVPGTDWDGTFHGDVFEKWMQSVTEWSKDNDRFEVCMHTIGGALSYVELDEVGLIDSTIMAELNKIQNDELRRGYELGTFNQRGVHWVDPEGKPEKELARKYQQRADAVEEIGYARFAASLRRIADNYLAEAEANIREFGDEEDD